MIIYSRIKGYLYIFAVFTYSSKDSSNNFTYRTVLSSYSTSFFIFLFSFAKM